MAVDRPASIGSEIPASVGARLRAHREDAGVSLRAFARTLGVSPSLISQIEHGKATPSVGTLYAIVTELGISLDDLFSVSGSAGPEAGKTGQDSDDETSAGGTEPPASSEGPVLRKADRPVLNLGRGVRWGRLTPTADPDVDFLHVVYDIGSESCPADAMMTHTGSEYGTVLEGRLGATVGFDSYELAPGDSIAFNSSTPHRFWAIGSKAAVVIWMVVGRQGDPRVEDR